MSESPAYPTKNPPPMTVAASLVAVEGAVLVMLAVAELADLSSERVGLGLSTAVFFLAYGTLLLASSWALWRRRGWARGPVLITQLILLGLAWSMREHVVVAIGLVVCAGIVLAGMVHPDTIEALEGGDQPSDSSD